MDYYHSPYSQVDIECGYYADKKYIDFYFFFFFFSPFFFKNVYFVASVRRLGVFAAIALSGSEHVTLVTTRITKI